MLKKSTTKHTDRMIDENQKSRPGGPLTTRPKEGISLFIGQDLSKIEKVLGKPQRIDQTIYGYEWYIYRKDYKHYLQVGVENNHVVTIYAIGDDLDVAPFEIGQPLEEIFNTQYIDTNIDINLKGNIYRFELNDTDINLRPLIQLGNVYAQLYFDKITGTLSSVRFLDAESLVKLKPYELVYNGDLINLPKVDESLWTLSEDGTEKEILDLTNVLRIRNKLKPLKWDQKLAEAALEHSKEMFSNSNDSDVSKKYGTLTERLKTAGIDYRTAGENIAVNYSDAPSVVEGWLNSEPHRAALLNKDYSQLGAGVYHDYYTLDFIQK